MPDITMCSNIHCPFRERCRRSPASGTKPARSMQYWAHFTITINGECPDFLPKEHPDA
jgi:hypothetical protein